MKFIDNKKDIGIKKIKVSKDILDSVIGENKVRTTMKIKITEAGLKKIIREEKIKVKNIIKEFLDEPLKSRNGKLYDDLVPNMGKTGTVEGEMLRAINKIVYRYYNDGDKFYEGYGCETAGPAHSFLVNSNKIDPKIQKYLQQIFSDIEFSNDSKYEKGLTEATELIVSYLEKLDGNTTKSTEDMYDFEPIFEEEEEEDDEDDYWREEEDEDDYSRGV